MINPEYDPSKEKATPKKDVEDLLEGIKNGELQAISRAITLVESQLESDQQLVVDLLAQLPAKLSCRRIAITGSPGVGKSSFIEYIGLALVDQGLKVAVLSIDPSDHALGGSILGDKTRMQQLSQAPGVFIRPSPSSSYLGGTNPYTKESISVLNAAGFNIVFIETVGVGQSELDARFLSDVMLVLVQPGSGDDLQAMKRGLWDYTDLFVVTKADGAQLDLARQAKHFLLQMNKLNSNKSPAAILLSSIHQSDGAKAITQEIQAQYIARVQSDDYPLFLNAQEAYWFEKHLAQFTMERIHKLSAFKESENLLKKEGGIAYTTALAWLKKNIKFPSS